MCGINGIFAYAEAAPPVDESELLRTREHMAKRGPDGAGLWIASDRRVGLAHRRLAIIDLSEAGAQPMSSADGRLQITFNGEIYNYRELRKDLEAKGCAFRSDSDTEVLLQLYAMHGAEMVHKLRGMYAFGIWDERENALFLARDPFGIKPLYYTDDGSTFRFASQVKALLAGDAIDAAPEPAGSVGFLLWGAVPEPFTMYRNIHALPAGAWLYARRAQGSGAPSSYFSVRDELVRAQEASPATVDRSRSALAEALRDSVRHHLVADVPVGVFLSAGRDSSTVTGLAVEEGARRLHTLTLGFREYQGTANDEVPLAEIVAGHYGTKHETRWIRRDDFDSDLARVMDAMDQPTTDGVNTWFVSKAAAQAGMKVALSGLGGDELFGGYPSFRQVPRIARWFTPAGGLPAFGRSVRRALAPLLGRFTSPKYAGLLEYGGSLSGAYLLRRALFMPWEMDAALDPANVAAGLERLKVIKALDDSSAGIRTPYAKVAALEFVWYMRNQLLRDADWAGMAHSLEIRVPFVDITLFRAVAPLLVSDVPPDKSAATRALTKPLPEQVLQRSKTGFTTPVRDWTLRREVTKSRHRGLRGWALRHLPRLPRALRIMVLVTDAFGGKGGIAKFNRDLITVIAEMPECEKIIVLPRLILTEVGEVPRHVEFAAAAARGKLSFLWQCIAQAAGEDIDLVVTGHMNLAPLGAFLAWLKGARSMLVVHGIDAWQPHPNFLVRYSLPKFDQIVGVSRLTLDRLGGWSGVSADRMMLLPNCVDMTRFGSKPKDLALARRLGVEQRTVLMTVGRLASEERYKGFDEVLHALPQLAEIIPNISYVICGEGSDRTRLEELVRSMNLSGRVVFAGFIPESRKADYYRLADAYVMPSRGEGFGIVFLEAMASGVPVMGSKIDGGREALLDGALGVLVDPNDPDEVVRGILQTLARPRGVPSGLDNYAYDKFRARTTALMTEFLLAA